MKKWKNPMLTAGIFIFFGLVFLALFIPEISSFTYTEQNPDIQNQGASLKHLLGTDKFGRDLLVRVCYGTRISLVIGVGSAVICGAIGTVYGCMAGYTDGKGDMILMRMADIIDAVPSLLYVILITLALGADAGSILLGICISGFTSVARTVRGEIKKLKTRQYVTAARLAGAGHLRIVFVHLLPNALGPLIVNLMFFVPKAIFTEAFLSFVGVGIQAPKASLGTLIQESRSQMQLYPSQIIWPILVLCILILAVNCIGTGLTRKMESMEEG